MKYYLRERLEFGPGQFFNYYFPTEFPAGTKITFRFDWDSGAPSENMECSLYNGTKSVLIYQGSISPYEESSYILTMNKPFALMVLKMPSDFDDEGYTCYLDVEIDSCAIATTLEAAAIGGSGTGSNKCIIMSMLQSFGCMLKTPVPSGIEYETNQAVRYGDIEKAEKTLSFQVYDRSTQVLLSYYDVSSISINGTTYTDLSSRYDSANGQFSFIVGGDINNISYSVIPSDTTKYLPTSSSATYESLNNSRVYLTPKEMEGQFVMTGQWDDLSNHSIIFDLYTLVYDIQAPAAGEDAVEDSHKLLELSYQTANKDYIVSKNGQKAITVKYDTLNGSGSWNPGENTIITPSDGMTLEDVFRNYSFVYIMNSYSDSKPGNTSTTGNFNEYASGTTESHAVMSMNFSVGDKVLNIPIDMTYNDGSAADGPNWIICRTKILGATEVIADNLSNLIEVQRLNGASYFDDTNSCKTNTYSISDGGRGPYVAT